VKKETTTIFTKYFGEVDRRDPRDICVFAFEPNPVHKERQEQLKEAYGNVGIRYLHIPVGVSDMDGKLTLYHQGGTDPANNEKGFSTKEFKLVKSEKVAVELPVIRLKKWLEDHIYERDIPENPFGGAETLKMEPSVIMKMDIEGSEYQVLPDLMSSGVLCNTVNYIFGEWHTSENAKFISLKKYRQLNTHLEAVLNILANVDGCKFEKFNGFDDESYHMDGVPLPPPVPWWNSTKVHL